ncbi:MAG: hypothetical protein ACLVES_01965 [Faecalibacterium prausnitzii]
MQRPAELPYLAQGETCPAAAELMGRLAEEKPTHSRCPQPAGLCPAVRTGGRRQRRARPAAAGAGRH